MILVDSNVLIDVLTNDPVWQEWSSEQLDTARQYPAIGHQPADLR